MRKGFVFDLDGVITDTAEYHYLAWKALAAKIGIEIDRKFNEQLKGISRMESLELILQHGNQAKDYDEAAKQALAAEKNTHYVAYLQQLTPKDVLPGVLAFLKAAKIRQLPCSVASASKNAPFILEKLELTSYFVGLVDPASLHKGKPDPEIFLKATELLDQLPSETIGFEDAQAGIDGIKAAGLYAIGVDPHHHLQHADMLIQSFDELDIDYLLTV